jgi:hypothetical protein
MIIHWLWMAAAGKECKGRTPAFRPRMIDSRNIVDRTRTAALECRGMASTPTRYAGY